MSNRQPEIMPRALEILNGAPAAPLQQEPLGTVLEKVNADVDAAIAANSLDQFWRLMPRIALLDDAQIVPIRAKALKAFPELTRKDFDTDGLKHCRKAKVGRGTLEPVDPGRPYGWNDAGNGDRLAELQGENLIWCRERKAYMVWTGTHWAMDELAVERLAEQTLRAAFAEAGEIPDQIQRKAFLRFLNRSLEQSGIANMVRACRRKVEEMSITDFDTNPMLLNCRNGTIDLRTGELRGHCREDRISKLIPFDFDPAAECPRFMAFLFRNMGSDSDAGEAANLRAERLVGYLQRAIGCGATGKPEKALFILHGKKDNGKTTLLEVLRAALGNHEYAGQVQVDTLMVSPKDAMRSNTVNADLADLKGKRFISSSEVEKSQRLSLARVKYLTGMGEIRARHLAENFFNFPSTHKIYMDCNDRPVVSDPNDAVWNRVRLIPFDVVIPKPEQDPNLREKLLRELPGILRWIVEGARAYLAGGLQDIPEVTAATESYRQDSDRLAEFFTDRCVLETKAWLPVSALWQGYEAWSESAGERFPLPKAQFDERVQRLGCTKGVRENGTVRAWVGIRFRTQHDKVTTSDCHSV